VVEIRVVSEHAQGPADEPPAELAAPAPSEPEPPLAADQILAEGDRLRLERRARQVSEQEAALGARAGELSRREEEIARREAELEAAFGFREDRVEQREAELADAQARLDRREQELTTYVSRLQAEFSRRG